MMIVTIIKIIIFSLNYNYNHNYNYSFSIIMAVITPSAPRIPQDRPPPGPPSPRTARELQTCTFEGPDASNTTKIPREDPQEREERKKIVAGGKKARNFGPPTLRCPTPSGPIFLGSGAHQLIAAPLGPPSVPSLPPSLQPHLPSPLLHKKR